MRSKEVVHLQRQTALAAPVFFFIYLKSMIVHLVRFESSLHTSGGTAAVITSRSRGVTSRPTNPSSSDLEI